MDINWQQLLSTVLPLMVMFVVSYVAQGNRLTRLETQWEGIKEQLAGVKDDAVQEAENHLLKHCAATQGICPARDKVVTGADRPNPLQR